MLHLLSEGQVGYGHGGCARGNHLGLVGDCIRQGIIPVAARVIQILILLQEQ